ncbi:hypothetical protein ACFQ3N_03155 [Virgibacillus byunsanensis]|uniref:Uncharacterized protein n=1 Tax=Virgibacillus byunsanensis TaxID=570945 RepID=A0ABW3LIY5_9BACI
MKSEWGIEKLENSYQISFVGTGANLIDAATNGLGRVAQLCDITVPEVTIFNFIHLPS